MITSKVTARAQTTIPRGVRDALEIRPGDELAYEVRDGYVVLRRRDDVEERDPAIEAFLRFIVNDISKRPEALRPVSEELVQRARELVAGTAFDPDEAIEGEVAL